MSRMLRRFIVDHRAATSVEYALIAVGIAAVIVSAVQGLGSTLNSSYGSVSAILK